MNTAVNLYPKTGEYCNFRGEDGQYFINGGQLVTILYISGEAENLALDAFNQYVEQGFLKLKKTLQRAPVLTLANAATQQKIDYWSVYLRELAKRSKPCSLSTRKEVIADVSKRTCDSNPPSPSNLYKKYRAFRDSELGVAGLFTNHSGTRAKRYGSPAISDLATQIIDDYYLKRNGLSVRQCYQIFVDVFGERSSNNKDDLFGEKCPSQATFYNWINQLPYLDVVASREGKRAATKYKRKCLKKFKLDNILDRVEIDAAHFNIGLKDDEGNYLGPALVYVAIDCYSRAILGYYIQVGGGESADGVAKCIFSILGDKNESGIKTTNRWVMFGSPLTLVSDAGPAFISKQIQGLFEFLENTTPITTESGQPWKKPFIERWFGTVRTQLLSTLPGYVGKRTDQKELSISMRKSASLTLKEFEEVFVQYIVDDYHQARHSGLDNLTPYEAWIEGARSAPPMAIHNLDRLKEFRGEHQSRMLQRTGITVNNVSYYSEELHAAALQLPSAFPHEADVYFNKEDIGQITVRLLNGETFNVPAKVDFEHLSGMRLHEYKVLRAKQKADAEVRREMVHEFAGGKRVPVAISYAKENKGKNFDESFKKTPSFNPKAVAKEAEMLSYHMNNPEQLSERPDTATNSGIEPYSSDSGFLSDDFFKEEPDTLEDI